MEAFIILLLIFINGVFSMAEIAMISSRKSKLNAEASNGDKAARAAVRISSDPDKFLSTVQMGVTLVGILTGIFSGDSLARDFASLLTSLGIGAGTASVLSKGIIVFIVMFLSILLGELIPKRIAMSNPEKVAKALAGLMRFVSWTASPVVWLLAKSTALCAKALGIKERESKVTEDEIKSIIEEGKDEGEVSPVEVVLVHQLAVIAELAHTVLVDQLHEKVAGRRIIRPRLLAPGDECLSARKLQSLHILRPCRL